jgi:hypothetical protein
MPNSNPNPDRDQFFDDFWEDLTESGPRRDPNASPTNNNTGGGTAPTDGKAPISTKGIDDYNTPPDGGVRSLEEYLRALGGGSGFSSGGGGGGGTAPSRFADLEAIMLSNKLPNLDKATLERLALIKNAQTTAAGKVFGEGKDALLEDLFGRGIQRSTIAGETGERLLTGQAQTMAGIEGEAGARHLALQGQLADRRLKGASSAGNIRADLARTNAQRAVGMAQAGATVAAARMNNATRMALGMRELDLKRDLGFAELNLGERSLGERMRQFDEELAYNKWQYEDSKPKWWEKALGFAGAILPSVVPFIPGFGGGGAK